jgi:putative transposase
MKEVMSYIAENEDVSIRRQCELLEICRSSVYYKTMGESPENLELMRLLDEHYLDHPTYGILQMQDFLFFLDFWSIISGFADYFARWVLWPYTPNET